LFAQSTVSNGIAKAKYQFDETYAPAQYSFKAITSKENYKTITSELKFSVINGNIVITVKDVSMEQGGSGNFVATVLDEFGNPIANADVVFNRVSSVGRLNVLGHAVTNKEGVATFKFDVPAEYDLEDYNIVSSVADVDNYNDANTTSILTVVEKLSITGNKAYTVYYGNTVT
jgi:hypothetical protein